MHVSQASLVHGSPHVANTMQCEQRLLIEGLDRHKTHVGPAHGLADRLRGILGVNLPLLPWEGVRIDTGGAPSSANDKHYRMDLPLRSTAL
jgi:hypothetical protein